MLRKFSLILIAVLMFGACEDDATNPSETKDNPVIISITPNQGSIGDEVTISGYAFSDSKDDCVVSFYGADATEFELLSDSTLTAIVPTGAISGDVTVSIEERISNSVCFTITNCEILDSLYENNSESLHLPYMSLTELPDCIGNLTELKWLDLECNRLTSLPESIGNLKNMIGLSLSGNELISLPEWIGNMTELDRLSLWGINVTILPESIGNLTKLKWLNLSYNHLTSLPESIGNMTNLRSLFLEHNALTYLPESIGHLTKLEELDLSGNYFSVEEKAKIESWLPNCTIEWE
jgi:hypothetical protein